jgi:hypothetical protein
MTVIVTPTYAEAQGVAFIKGLDDWLWVAHREIAVDWMCRCWERDVDIQPIFIRPETRRTQ